MFAAVSTRVKYCRRQGSASQIGMDQRRRTETKDRRSIVRGLSCVVRLLFPQPWRRALVRAAFLPAAERRTAPLVRAAWRAEAERCAVLCCAVLCCAVLCCAVLCCAALRLAAAV